MSRLSATKDYSWTKWTSSLRWLETWATLSMKKSKDLLTLDTKDIALPNATERFHTHFERGRIRFDEFIHCLGSEENFTFYEPIKNSKIDFFRQVPAPVDGKQKVLKDSSQGSSYQTGAEYSTYRSFFSITISHSLPQWQRKAPHLPEIPACCHPRRLSYTARVRTNGWCHHHWWLSFGEQSVPTSVKYIWRVCKLIFFICLAVDARFSLDI